MKDDVRPPEPSPAARDDVRLAVNRCPFCHDDVAVSDAAAVVCRQCLARHHGGCWSESHGCGSCRGTDALVASPTSLTSVGTRASGPPTRVRSTLTTFAFVVLGIAVSLGAMFALPFANARAAAIRAREQAARDEAVRREAEAQEARRLASLRHAEVGPRLHFNGKNTDSPYPSGWPLLDHSKTLLVTDGEHFGAVVFEEQTEAHAKYRFWYRSAGTGTFDPHQPGVETGEGTLDVVNGALPEVAFGPFRFPWAPGQSAGHGRAKWAGKLLFSSLEKTPEAYDPVDPFRDYYDAENNSYSPVR